MRNKDSPLVLIFSNNSEITDIIGDILHQKGCRAVTCPEVETCIEKTRTNKPSLIIIDTVLAGGNSEKYCRELKSLQETRVIPIMIIGENKNIKMFGEYYESTAVANPITSSEMIELSIKLKSMLTVKRLESKLTEKNSFPRGEIKRKSQKLQETYLQTVRSLAKAIESKNNYTQFHSYRVSQYAVDIAMELGINESDVNRIRDAAELLDLGHISIPNHILAKRGKLTKEEWDQVKKHPITSKEILNPLVFLDGTRDAIEMHHERYDGKGYPYGKKGEEIPITARILAVADAYDAMISDRPYRPAMTSDQAVEELKNNSGKQFDPGVVEAFLRIVTKS